MCSDGRTATKATIDDDYPTTTYQHSSLELCEIWFLLLNDYKKKKIKMCPYMSSSS